MKFIHLLYPLAFINLLTFIFLGVDKYKAVKDLYRIKESTLLLLGFCFGSLGFYFGMKVFRHKIRKPLFIWSKYLFLILHTVLIIFILIKFNLLKLPEFINY